MSKPRLMFDHDSRHTLIYVYHPPIFKDQIEAAVDELSGTPVDTLVWTLGEGRTMLHDTKVGEQWGHNVNKWPHLVFQRAHRNTQKLISENNDPLRVICERAHQKGMMLYPNLILQQQYTKPGTDPRSSNFRFNNRHLEIGAKGDLDKKFPGRSCLDFRHQEVRDERFSIIEEIVNNYPVDGFQLNFNHRMPIFFHPDEVEQGRKTLTEWVERVHNLVKNSGPNRELAVCIPTSIEQSLSGGLDPLEWIKRGIVDIVVAQSFSLTGPTDPTADLTTLVEASKGTECHIHGAINSGLDSDRLALPSIEMVRATACNYYEQGIDGIYLAHWFAYWPYKAEFYETLRELKHPDIMASKDKIYSVPTGTGRQPNPIAYAEHSKQLPSKLKKDESVWIKFPVSDDLPRWDKVNRVHEVILRILVMETTELDQLSFKLNGKELPETLLRKINQMYRMASPRYRVFGYWFVFRLDNEHWPQKGNNTLGITLLERDPDVTTQIQVRNVELEIKYLMGKNFHRGYVDPDLGPYEHTVS